MFKGIKVGLVMPDRGDRPIFFERALQYIARQTVKPDQIEIVNGTYKFLEGITTPDLVYRYEYGFQRCFNHEDACDVVICMESDDWYSPHYIEAMLEEWLLANKPPMIGTDSSVYYHIGEQRFSVFRHSGRSSMNSMLVTKEVLKHKFDYADPYLDFRLWQKFKGKTFSTAKNDPIVIGIKHGQGMVAGSGHVSNWSKYETSDPGFKLLETSIGRVDVGIYKVLAERDNYQISKTSHSANPFLSIITRMHGSRRPKGLSANLNSVAELTSDSYEHIFLNDQKGLGRPMANISFSLVVPDVKGQYVFLLDDDDFLVNKNMIEELQQIVEGNATRVDVIVFRNIIKNGSFDNYYPSPECWASKVPKIAHIGGSCFVCRTEVFKEFVMHFGRPACGDFHMLDAMYKSNKLNWYWHDSLMMETGVVSRGKTETEIKR